MQNSKPSKTPLPQGWLPTTNIKQATKELRSKFQQVIGSLLYLMLGTRPDICFAVIKLSQHSANPSQEHLDKALGIFRYLNATKKYEIIYDGLKGSGLIAFCDSDWASDKNNRRSQWGFVFELAKASIYWTSRLQKSVALSSTEAEYVSFSETAKTVLGLKNVFAELGMELSSIPIIGDNQGAIFLAKNSVIESRSKHIDVRFHAVRQWTEENKIHFNFTPGNENRADILTKSLGWVKFIQFRNELGIRFY